MRVLVRAICIAAGIAGMTSAAHAARYYYAACLHESHGYFGYNGPRHADASDAGKDCDEHRKIYPRHRCNIQPIDY
jgi:hypothetical protein